MATRILVLLGCGLLVGMERHWSHKEVAAARSPALGVLAGEGRGFTLAAKAASFLVKLPPAQCQLPSPACWQICPLFYRQFRNRRLIGRPALLSGVIGLLGGGTAAIEFPSSRFA